MQTQLQLLTSEELLFMQTELEAARTEVEKYRNRVICCRGDQNSIQRRGKARLVELVGKENYKNVRRRGFSLLWTDYKKQFNLESSFRDTLEKDYPAAIVFIGNWQPVGERLAIQ